MKSQKIFPGIILLGFGLYFFLQQNHIEMFKDYYTWPTLLILVGIGFLGQGYGGKDYEAILPGVILVGFGLHFHIAGKLSIWPDHIGVFILIISLGFLLRFQKTRNGLFHGILFLIISIILLFYNEVFKWMGLLDTKFASILNFWPFLLIAIGLYLLFFKRK
ncbi:LiaI-LiaF-like domain-containing protein [Heyndrickxia sp. NPDC080065]|uniref:LiaI-LiaF-like domain-containing protein n=1 Tax=Heyndrickxia sp. NPDC080065 TaxID=3390568 RepID=UPI003CFCCA1B